MRVSIDGASPNFNPFICSAVGNPVSPHPPSGLPAALYATFGLEARFGFNKMTLKLYLTDKVKGLAIGLIIGVPFLFLATGTTT